MGNHPSNRVTFDNLEDVVTYHAPTLAQIENCGAIRAAAKGMIGAILKSTPDCADRAAAIRKVREAMMTANAAVALEPAGDA